MGAQTASPTRRKVPLAAGQEGRSCPRLGQAMRPQPGRGAGEKLHFPTRCWRAGPGDQPRHRRSVPSGQGGTTSQAMSG